MATPVRLQLSRRRGFNLQALSRETNGLEAVNVARPSVHGNKYRVGVHGDAAECVRLFREDWKFGLAHPLGNILLQQSLAEMRGKNLACWCKLGDPCHASVLLELANTPDTRSLDEAARR